jgi:hypothetical protein
MSKIGEEQPVVSRAGRREWIGLGMLALPALLRRST